MENNTRQHLLNASPAFLLSLVFGLAALPDVVGGQLLNPDSAMRLVRLEAILRAGAPLSVVARDGSGTLLQWSHLLDSLLICLAGPAALFLGWHHALATMAPLVGPLSMAALGAALAWASRPYAAPQWRLAGSVMICLSPVIMNYGLPGVVHHHVLLAVVAVMAGGSAMRIVQAREPGTAAAIGLGAWVGVGAWLSPESVPLGLMAICLVWLAWLRQPQPALARALAIMGATLFLVTAAAFLVDPPAGAPMAPEQDRISIVFVSLAAAIALGGAGAALGLSRVRAVAFCGGMAAAWLSDFPALLAGTDGLLPPGMAHVFFDGIVEMRPVGSLHAAVADLAPAAIAGIWLAVLGLRRQSVLFVYGAACAAIMVVAGAMHVRFATYPATFAAAMLPVALTQLSASRLRAVALALALLLPRAGDFIADGRAATAAVVDGEAATAAVVDGRAAAAAVRTCSTRGVAGLLAAHPGQVVLGDVNDTPDLLWHTQVRTVGSLYHGSPEGFMRLRAAWLSPPGLAMPPAVARTGATLVLACPGAALPNFVDDASAPSLVAALQAGRVPPWLHRLGQADAGGLVLYAADRTASP